MKYDRKRIIALALAISLTGGYINKGGLNSISYAKEEENTNDNSILLEVNKILEKMALDKEKKDYEEKVKSVKEELDNTINLYSSIYNVNSDVVRNIVSNYTDNFTKDSFINNHTINDGSKHDSFDCEIIYLTKDIKNNPGNYNLDYESIKSMNYNDINYDGTIRNFVYKTSNAIGLDPMLALSIACAESYYFEAGIATSNNNPFSLRGNSDFYVYDNLYEGILAGEICLKKGYIDKGLTTLSSISESYCGGSSTWVNLVEDVQSALENGKTLYDEEEKTLSLN